MTCAGSASMPLAPVPAEDPENLEIVVADRRGVAEIVARRRRRRPSPDRRALAWVEGGEIGPDRLRRRPLTSAEAEIDRWIDRLIFPDEPTPLIGPSHSAMMRSA